MKKRISPARPVVFGLVAATLSTMMTPSISRADYYTEDLGSFPASYVRNDDASFGPYSLGFNLDYFGQSYSQFFLNNNGSISFGNPFGTFTPEPLNTTTIAPTIAPYWADVDTRPSAGGNLFINASPDQLVVTWDKVGYFSRHTEQTASFQLVLRGPNYPVPAGEGQIGFFYKEIEWETGDASGGSGGFGGVPATIGFGDGLFAINQGEVSLQGSQQNGIGASVQNQSFWFNLSSSGEIAGSSEGNPILPGAILPGGTLVFDSVPSGLWFDPPFTDRFDYHMTNPGDLFTDIIGFPSAFSDLMIDVGGSTFGPFNSGDTFSFPGGGVVDFTVFNINPTVDAADPMAFPLQLLFNNSIASFTMSPGQSAPPPVPVPEAGTFAGALGLGALVAFGMVRRKG